MTALAAGAGSDDGWLLPEGAPALRNDAGCTGISARRRRRARSAPLLLRGARVDVPRIGIPRDAGGSYLGFPLFSHTLARATVVAEHER